jgi:aminopeptidase-like protein
LTATDVAELGPEMMAQIREMYPICRSITGNGARETLRLVQRVVPIEVHEVPSGTPVLDWTVPNEWNIRDAYVKDTAGNRVIDFQESNLHVVGYSTPVKARMSLEALKPHLFSLPDRPALVPYRTSYYNEAWGFCLAHDQLSTLADGEYEVLIDSTLSPGSLSYGELVVPGETQDEVLLSTHTCHPSLVNDNLTGIAIASRLAALLSRRKTRYTYRFLFIPGTIGSITWLALNEGRVQNIKHGLVLSGLGDAGGHTYKRSRRGDSEIDRAAEHVLRHSDDGHAVVDFTPYGYDERQYCSPGFNLAVGNLSRTPFGQYPEYHTSGDNLDFIREESLTGSLEVLLKIVDVLEGNRRYRNLNPKGEPQLGRRGLYDSIGGRADTQALQMALLWVLNFSDGDHSLLDIAGRAGVPFALMREAADALEAQGLLEAL